MKPIVLSSAARDDRDAIDEYTIEHFGLQQAIRTREAFRVARILHGARHLLNELKRDSGDAE